MPRSKPSIPSEAIAKLKYLRDNPAEFVKQVIGAIPEPWQIEALNAIRDGDRVAIRSGHGVGKSAMMSWLILWWLSTRFPAKIAATAPTAHQLEDVLWGEVAKWHRSMLNPFFRDQLEVKGDRVCLKEAPNESFAVARTARKEQPEAFQGFHSDNMLFLVDEASGVEDIIFEVGEGAMSTQGAKTLMVGNPTRTSGYFYDAFHMGRAHWRTLKVGCSESSRVGPDYPAQMASRYGVDSNIYRVRVLGEFPLSEDDVVIPLHLVESAKDREVETYRVTPVWGLDVARFGSDRSALAKRRGNTLLAPIEAWSQLDTMQTAGKILREWHLTPADMKPHSILVDVIGIGAGVVDRLRELGLPARGVNVAEAASSNDRFMRLRDELWFTAREWFEARDTKIAEDEELVGELVSVKYKITSSGKLQVESKDEMKKRAMRSPDLADAFILTFGGGADRYPDLQINTEPEWAEDY